MSKYSHIMQPIKLGNIVLKSRLLCANALPHFLQGPETWPADPIMFYLSNIAKNGAAVVTFGDWTKKTQRIGSGDGVHFPMFNTDDPSTENYLAQLTEAIHFYGSKAIVSIVPVVESGYGVCDSEGGMPPFMMGGPRGDDDDDSPGGPGGPGGPPPMQPGKDGEKDPMMEMMMAQFGPKKAMGLPQMQACIDGMLEKARYYEGVGFDGVSLHMAYQGPIGAQFLSPLCNKRIDEFGGPIENRAKFPIMMIEAFKKEFGQDFLVEVIFSGNEGDGGITIDDSVKFAKMCEGKADIFQLRGKDGDEAHPTGFNSERGNPVTLQIAKAIMDAGVNIATAPIGGFQDLDDIEEYLATGQTNMIGIGRAFVCDPDYGKKIVEGRGDDVIPCIRCNRCHGFSMQGPWLSACSVNPVVGLGHKIERMIAPAQRAKKVAIIGGGLAGMYAAMTSAQRGHSVVLFEKSGVLGGQLLHSDFSSFKWPLRDFKDFLVHQMDKLGVDVRLNTPAAPELVKAEGFDAVLAAVGAVPNIPDIGGLTNPDGSLADGVWNPIQVYGHENELGKNVVVIGGSEIGTETGMYLAENGHNVTVLSRQGKLAKDADRVHFYDMFIHAANELDGFNSILRATTTKVESGKVTYVRKGQEQTIETDSIVIAGGMNPCNDLAMSFYDCAPEFYMMGDCTKIGNVQKVVRSAYALASQI